MDSGLGKEADVCAGQMVSVRSVEERSKVSATSPGYFFR